MQIVSKTELKERLKNYDKEQIIEMLHRAWEELSRIEERSKSIWYKDVFFKRK